MIWWSILIHVFALIQNTNTAVPFMWFFSGRIALNHQAYLQFQKVVQGRLSGFFSSETNIFAVWRKQLGLLHVFTAKWSLSSLKPERVTGGVFLNKIFHCILLGFCNRLWKVACLCIKGSLRLFGHWLIDFHRYI